MALCPWAFVSQSSFLGMISVQQVLHKLLLILRFVRNYIVGRIARRWRLSMALLGRRTRDLRGSNPGTSQCPEAGEPLLPGNRAGSSLRSSEYVVVAASTVDDPASPASFQGVCRMAICYCTSISDQLARQYQPIFPSINHILYAEENAPLIALAT